jgi:hypothetical protein
MHALAGDAHSERRFKVTSFLGAKARKLNVKEQKECQLLQEFSENVPWWTLILYLCPSAGVEIYILSSFNVE